MIILISGETEATHLKTVEEVPGKLNKAGLRLKREKCAFMLNSVEYLGHNISADGLRPTEEKIRAIAEAPAPRNVAQLCSFLGLVNFYGKFLPQLSSTLSLLYKLLQKHAKWIWDQIRRSLSEVPRHNWHRHAYWCTLILTRSSSSPVTHHHMDLGQSCRIVWRMGRDKPVAFASRSLAPAEKRYAQLEKEGLAIIYVVKKFHQYLFGRKFTIYSDHKPLQHLF